MTDTGPFLGSPIDTVPPGRLVIMLLEGSLAAIDRAVVALNEDHGGVEIAHRELSRAQDIVRELQLSLDHEAGGQIAQSLDALYCFCLEGLVRANVAKDPHPLASVSHILNELLDCWGQAVATLPAGV